MEPIYIHTCAKISAEFICLMMQAVVLQFLFFLCIQPSNMWVIRSSCNAHCHCIRNMSLFQISGKKTQIIAGKMYNYLHPCLDMKDRLKKLSTIIFIHIWEQSVEWKGLSQVGTALYLAYNVMYAFLLFGIYYLFFLFFLLINCFSFFNSLPLMH